MPPTFASAAAHNANATRESAEWARRPNGATQTFRRASGTPSATPSAQQQDLSAMNHPARYVPPHRSNGSLFDTRYSKDQLLDLYKLQQQSEGGLSAGLADMCIGGWRPDAMNGTAGSAWGRGEQNRDTQPGPDICWDGDGAVEPLGLVEMDDEERELFATSVNTPLKAPTTVKESQQSNGVAGGRKVSISNQATTPGGYGPLTPTATRGSGRRRETGESLQSLANPLSPTAAFGRDEQRAASPPPSLTRRRTDTKDAARFADREAEGDEKQVPNPFGSLKRTTTNPLNTGFGSASSPWTNVSQSAGLSPMGSFGNFGLGQPGTPGDKRSSLGGGRAESRFKNVLNKDDSEDVGTKPVERKTSLSSLSRVNENESWRPQQPGDVAASALDENEEDFLPASRAFGADSDLGMSQHYQGSSRGFGAPGQSESRDEYGFGAFGMTPDNASGFGQGFAQQNFAHQRLVGDNEPMSPTGTNPYQSPEQHAVEHLSGDIDSDDMAAAQLPGLGGFGGEQAQNLGGLGGLGALPNFGRVGGNQITGSDRSQTSSAGPARGFPSLGSIGHLGGISGAAAWPVSHGGIGTPTRQTSGLSSAFGSGIFAGAIGDVQSPGLSGLGGGSMLNPLNNVGGSRMASMFPSNMQEQIRQSETDQGSERGFPGEYEQAGDNASGYGESHRLQMDSERSLDQLSGQLSAMSQPSQQAPIGQPSQLSQGQARSQQPATQRQSPGQGPPPSSSSSSQLPPTQQRTMVMPDRMRWIYRDPQGQTQGPWSGLEMHDWYKAGFFSPELLVKKYEDPEYEPLAQLIRRIGNSREPFLVPQIGIPHGQPSNSGPNAWAGSGSAGTATGTQGAQPPFASSFPSFGTTLTAEQQNALERRKQEEQYLMARQKEHLAQAQIAQRMQHQQQMHHGSIQHHGAGNLLSGSSQLHHHASAQSLHSQPSFGSLGSPGAAQYQSSPSQAPQGQTPGFFDSAFRNAGQNSGLGAVGSGVDSLGQIREEEIPSISERLTFGQRAGQGHFGAPGQQLAGQQIQSSGAEPHERQVQQMLEDRARLQQEQDMQDAMQHAPGYEQGISDERLQQFQQLQGKMDSRFESNLGQDHPLAAQGAGRPQQQTEPSLTEQVQKAASAQQSPVQPRPGLPQPFPPAPTGSPLPAPAAQRTGRQSVADQLQTEHSAMSETSSVDTPSAVAPWAKEVGEANKGPSLKAIQEMEAKKAAEAEELASAARRAAFQKEMEAQAQAQAQTAVAPGLPASASWAAGSPATPTATSGPAWAKAAQKPATSSTAKSMAQIQKEEEARKKRLAAAALAAQGSMAGTAPILSGGKSYANLAGKVASPPGVSGPGGGAWTTVGAGGKSKTPAAAAPPPPTATRAMSSSVVPTAEAAAAAASTRRAPTRSSTMTGTGGGVNAQEEFRRWAVGELRPDLDKSIPAEEFVANLVALPQDADIITEAVHGASSTIDSRHFAGEFIRRKKLADKGLVDASMPPKSASPHSAGVDKSGGWSEVAKKGPAGHKEAMSREESNGNFRVVASKKKGGKR